MQGQHSGHKQSRRFLECIDDNFLTQVIEEMMRGAVLLDLILTNKEELFRNAKVGAALAAVTMRWQCSGS